MMKSISKLDERYEHMGYMNEKQYKPIIASIYGDVKKTSNKYCTIDFIGNDYCGEIKSRNLNIDTFSDTMIGYNKIVKGFEKLNWYRKHIPNYKIYFWFAFKEGLYVWELNEENYKLNGGDSKKRLGGTNKRGYDDYKDHYYIKTELLVKIDDTPVYIDQMVEDNSYKQIFFKEGVCLI